MSRSKKTLIIDCQVSGIAGDMLLGALIDLGADINKVKSAIKSLENPAFGYKNLKIDISHVMRGEFRGTQINIVAESNPKSGTELISIVENAASDLKLPPKAKRFVSEVIHKLVGVEADLHRTSFDVTHLHEVSLVDTAAEILGVAVALEDLALFDSRIYSTPLAVGGGTFHFSHGIVSSPAPATLEILQSKNFPFHGGPVEAELATPTGASILANLVDEVSVFYPAIVPLKLGYGAGTKNFPGVPTVLRLTIGESLDSGFLKDEIAVLETNLDDTTGEVLGYTIDKLLAEGAKDVSMIPMYTKKNRPGQIIKVISEQKDVQNLSRILIDETGTLGVRVYYCQRHIINRELHIVDLLIVGNKETVKVKVVRNQNGEIIRIKPEYEDLKRLSEKTKKPLRELLDLAVLATQEQFHKE
jgi:uncharacterized protein (TIGR00299 family) protein